MFGQVFITQLKRGIRNKQSLFWCLAFPIALGTLMHFAFGSIYNSNKSTTIDARVIVEDSAIQQYKTMMAFTKLGDSSLENDMKDYYERQGTALAMGQEFDEEPPIDEDFLKELDDIGSYDDVIKVDYNMFPAKYIDDDVASIDKDDLPFIKLINDLEYDDGTKMINPIYEDTDEEVKNTITVSGLNNISLEITENGLESSILSTVISTYKQNVDRIISVMNDNPDKLETSESLMNETTDSKEYVKATGLLGENKDPFVSYFYNIMAMVCTMASMLTFGIIVGNQANQTTTGIRIDASPVNKFVYEFAQYLAVNLIQLVVSFISLMYFLFALKINFGGNIQYIYLTTVLGTFLGTSIGYMIGHLGGISRKARENILVLISVGGGFLAGLMVSVIKPFFETHCPIINRINPSAVITDAFYALNMFGPGARYYRAIGYIVALTLIFIIIGAILSRRKQYASL